MFSNKNLNQHIPKYRYVLFTKTIAKIAKQKIASICNRTSISCEVHCLTILALASGY